MIKPGDQAGTGGAFAGFAKFVALGLAFAWNFLSRKYLLFDGAPATSQN